MSRQIKSVAVIGGGTMGTGIAGHVHIGDGVILGGMTGDAAYATAHHMRDSLAETDITPRHCQDLIDAFRQDAVKNRTDDWDDLMHYCIRSAAPVGGAGALPLRGMPPPPLAASAASPLEFSFSSASPAASLDSC